MTINRTMGPREWGLLLILSVLWGRSFFFIGVALAAGLAAIDGRLPRMGLAPPAPRRQPERVLQLAGRRHYPAASSSG